MPVLSLEYEIHTGKKKRPEHLLWISRVLKLVGRTYLRLLVWGRIETRLISDFSIYWSTKGTLSLILSIESNNDIKILNR